MKRLNGWKEKFEQKRNLYKYKRRDNLVELNKIYNENCLETMKRINDNSIDLIIADPPYGKGIDKWDKFTEEEFEKWVSEFSRILKNNGTLYFYGIPEALSERFHIFKNNFKYIRELVWFYRNVSNINHNTWSWNWQKILMCSNETNEKKRTFNLDDVRIPYSENTNTKRKKHDDSVSGYGIRKNDKNENIKKYNDKGKKPMDVIEIPRVSAGVAQKEGVGHKTQKPLKLCDTLIKASSNKGDLVYIPFAGSGSEIVSCINNQRNYIASEINAEYINKMIIPRIDKVV